MAGKNETRELISQQSWLCKDIVELLKASPTKGGTGTVKANFIDGNNTILPVLRIIKFLKKTDNNDLAVVLADSTHKIFARFPFKPTIVDFENTYNQRITYCTTNCLVLVKKAELIRVSPAEIRRHYDDLVSNLTDYLLLNVLALEIYQRDQILLTSDIYLKYIYQVDEYRLLCKHVSNAAKMKAVMDRIKLDNDDVVSL